MSSSRELIQRLANQPRPARPRRPAALVALVWLACSFGAVFLGLFLAHALRPGLTVSPATLALLVAALGAAVMAVVSGYPARELPVAAALVVPLAGIGFVVVLLGLGGEVSAAGLGPHAGLPCTAFALLFSAIPALVLLGLLRRLAPTRPDRSAAYVGVAAGALGAALIAFHCPLDAPLHVLFYHGGAALVLGVVLDLAGRRILRW